MAANVKVCEHFLKGNCRYGSNCKFTHVENSSSYLRKGIGKLKLYPFNFVLIGVHTVTLLWQITVEMFVRSICVESVNTVADAGSSTQLVPPMGEVRGSRASSSCAQCEYCRYVPSYQEVVPRAEDTKKTLLVTRAGAEEWCVVSGCCLSVLVLPDVQHTLSLRSGRSACTWF